ncbi:MAG: tRNA (adenosine(37)-N6)-dimethylallyltransferase MiaA [Candidatus Nomurabacteria bacterium]|nr:tRNA (adenosine(37)-N6)-dimethylallyltransferase MiaA [Candidatus Nomurabacteria bacterium]
MQKEKVIVILGQTATGKSNFAVKIAKQINGEIISADSRQIYKGLEIGSGKVTEREMKGIPHHILDFVNPKKKFTVAQYKTLADKKIKEILFKGKTPIVCGGTGFYIDAVVNNIVLPEVKPNLKLRKELEKKSAVELFKILKKLDSTRAKNIDAKNKVRLIRAIEIAQTIGKVPKIKKSPALYNFTKIGLYAPNDFLENKITKRIKKMFDKKNNGGLVNEVKKLKKSGLSDKRITELGFEYFYPLLFINKKITEHEMIERTILGNIQYAKRQMTWFKRDPEIQWINVSEPFSIEKVKKSNN